MTMMRFATLLCFWMILAFLFPLGQSYAQQESTVDTDELYGLPTEMPWELEQLLFQSDFLRTPGKRMTINVVSPNGGENWKVGREENIVWSVDGITSDLLIQLYRGEGELARSIYRVTATGGSAPWTVPPSIVPGGDYYMRISNLEDQNIFDESERIFNIEAGVGPSISVVYPNNIDVILRHGETLGAQWGSDNLTSNVNVTLLYDIAIQDRILAASTADDGSLNWTIPNTINPRDTYYISVRSSSDGSVWDTGQYFTIAYPAGQSNVTYFGQANSREALDVALANGFAIIADQEFITIANVTDPENPAFVNGLRLNGNLRDVAVHNGYAYLIQQGVGVAVVDISDVTALRYVGTFGTPGNAFGIDIVDGIAYIADESAGLHIWNLANPEAPSLLSTFNESNLVALDVEVANNRAYVANSTFGLRIIDVSNSSSPSGLGSFDTNEAWDVAVNGSRAYVADGASGLKIVDVSNPASPALISQFNTVGVTTDVAVEGSFVYLADGSQGLRIIDVSNEASPFESGHYRTLDDAFGVVVKDGYAFVAAASAGIQVIRNDAAASSGNCPVPTSEIASATQSFKVVGPTFLDVAALEIVESVLEQPGEDDREVRTRNAIAHTCFADKDGLREQFFFIDTPNSNLAPILQEVRVFDQNGGRLGHIELEDFDQQERLEAILYLHTESNLLPNEDLRASPDWAYYQESLWPMTMLVPPGQRFDNIDVAKNAMLFVHGLNGRFPYWEMD